MSRTRHRPTLLPAICVLLGACVPGVDRGVDELPLDEPRFEEALAPLAEAIGDRRIVLLGENGHGVSEHTALKVRLIEWLHRELGFEVVAMESGFFECANVWRRIEDLTPPEALLQCLRYPFQHAEILPLFEYIEGNAGSDRPLRLAGVDPQAQGFDSESRPMETRRGLSTIDADLGARIAMDDSLLFLPEASGGLGDGVYPLVLANHEAIRARYERAADLTDGADRWTFRLATGLVDRLYERARTDAAGEDRSARFYELRDEWMARAVSALADSIAGPRKVVVWLHNDHARYGSFAVGPHRVRSVGEFLAAWHPDEVFSVGLFMGSGVVSDNGRNERQVETPAPTSVEEFLGSPGFPASLLILSGNRNGAVRTWADAERPYLRMGFQPESLTPARAFDALLYVREVGPPDYRIPSPAAGDR